MKIARRLGCCVLTLAAASLAPAAEDAADEAAEAYEAAVTAYMDGAWSELPDALREALRCRTRMTPKQRADLAYVRSMLPGFRPAWWKSCKSTSSERIRARIWNRNIVASYVPADAPGMNAQVRPGGRMAITVSWNPSLVDSTTPQGGRLANRHDLTRGDIGEVIVWRQLGYSYMAASLPGKTLLSLYNENQHLYQHLQMFFANLTSMYHCSPKARRTAMLLYAGTLTRPDSASEAYVRSVRALASLMTAVVLAEPKAWPSVKLPMTVPGKQTEKRVGTALLNDVDPGWTLAEDRALREVLMAFFRTNAQGAFRSRGRLILPNRHVFMLMEPDDREHQAKRDAWVKARLTDAIDQGN